MSKIPHVKTPPRLMAQCCSEYEVLDIGENLTRSPYTGGELKISRIRADRVDGCGGDCGNFCRYHHSRVMHSI